MDSTSYLTKTPSIVQSPTVWTNSVPAPGTSAQAIIRVKIFKHWNVPHVVQNLYFLWVEHRWLIHHLDQALKLQQTFWHNLEKVLEEQKRLTSRLKVSSKEQQNRTQWKPSPLHAWSLRSSMQCGCHGTFSFGGFFFVFSSKASSSVIDKNKLFCTWGVEVWVYSWYQNVVLHIPCWVLKLLHPVQKSKILVVMKTCRRKAENGINIPVAEGPTFQVEQLKLLS